MDRKREFAVALLWAAAGFLAWRWALVLHRAVLLPVIPSILKTVGARSPFSSAVGFGDAVISHGMNFLMVFLAALGLSALGKVSPGRYAGLVLGADAVPLTYHLLQMAGYLRYSAASPGNALWMMTGGLAALLVGVPLFALAGVRLGRRIRRGPPTSPAFE